ncbi:ralA-binding protein 1-like [Paramacrobiotus metropolitanus]|uniref:ralA-binding protein 1-like n=1 Tax=Paramacrobiotus metropolitanus TaxID=2943436 RepID=UPI0024464B05|nr:ralA-binding protein 1-like [Paramacrobiotus metropolitanus]
MAHHGREPSSTSGGLLESDHGRLPGGPGHMDEGFAHTSQHHPSGNTYGFVKAKKKKEKGYRSVGLDSSDEDYNDAACIISSSQSTRHHPTPTQISSGSSSTAPSSSTGFTSYQFPAGSPSTGTAGPKSSKTKPAFRLKKKKSFKGKDLLTSDEPFTDSAVLQSKKSAKLKHKSSFSSNTNPFDDRPFAVTPLSVSTSSKKNLAPIAQMQFPDDSDTQIFGIPLTKAVQIDRCPDGLQIPAFFRVCVNYIEDNGLDTIGIYRTSGSQSRIQELKQHFNRGDRVRLNDYDVATVADVMKIYIRELPQKLLPEELLPDLEDALEIPEMTRKLETTHKILQRLEPCRRTLLGWVFVHMAHIMEHQDVNKMSLKNLALVLEPTLRIQSNKVLNFFLSYPTEIFHDISITKLTAPVTTTSTKSSGKVADNDQRLVQLREELAKKEVSLNHMHHEIKQGKASKRKEEQLWEIQRQVTQLKRTIRTFEKMTTVPLQPDVIPSSGLLIPTKVNSDGNKSPVVTKIEVRFPPVAKPSEVEPESASKSEKESPLAPVTAGDGLNGVLSEAERRASVAQALYLINVQEVLLNHNAALREQVAKESNVVVGLYEQLHDLQKHGAASHQACEEELTTLEPASQEQRQELLELLEKFHNLKRMTGELNDAICSETNDWMTIVAETNALRMQRTTAPVST